MLAFLLIVVALILFVLAAANVQSPRVGLVPLGLAFQAAAIAVAFGEPFLP
jgi:uncharacterized integral membrane protein